MKPTVNAPKDAPGHINALLHMVFSPLYMQRLQPAGTSGLNGQWEGNKPLWPGVDAVIAKIKGKDDMAIDFAAVQKLFRPKYVAWKAARAAPNSRNAAAPPSITLDQVLKAVDKVLVPINSKKAA